MYQYKTGVFLARMQPLHIAHLFLIKEALSECEQVCIVLGSSNKHDMLRNPLTFEFRQEVLKQALADEGYSSADLARITMFELPDWGLENDVNEPITWGRYFYYNVVSRMQQKNFAMYYSDDPAIINGWFQSEVGEHITLRLHERSSVYDGLSATRIREAILTNDTDYLNRFCPPAILAHLEYIRGLYQQVVKHPKDDFVMK